jgi:hypothetical protein
MLPAMFRLIWPSGFRGGDLKKLANQKQELPVEGHVWYKWIITKCALFRCFLLSFSSFGCWVSEEKIKM